MFYSQVILAKKGPLAKVWMAAHWGDKKLSRPQIFTTDIDQSCVDIMNPTVPLALRLSGHLLLGVVRIYSRKVKYVLHDCNEAMIKLKTTFAAGAGGPGGGGANANANNELLTDRDAATHHIIANFGEYDQVHVVEGFCVPLPEENEWVLADDDDDDSEEDDGSQQQRRFRRQAGDEMMLAGIGADGSGPATGRSPSAFSSPEEETWAPFDPENEDEDDDEDGVLPARSRVSDIEIARAAGDDSMLSDAADKTRRASSILDKSDLSGPEGLAPGRDDDDDGFDMHVPFDDEESDQGGDRAGRYLDDDALRLSDGEDGVGKNNVSGLDDDSLGSGGSKRGNDTAGVEQPKKRRKRRKVVVDTDKTELSDPHIKKMIHDTSSIIRKQIHPASVWEGDGRTAGLMPKKPHAAPVLTRPFVEDAEHNSSLGGPKLHPRLKAIWRGNFYQALGEKAPFKLLYEVEEIETARRATPEDDDDDQASIQSDTVLRHNDEETSKNPPADEEDDFGMPLPDYDGDEDEEEEPDEGGPPVDFAADDVEDEEAAKDENDLDLGLVNELHLEDDDEDDDEDRQALGEVSSSTNKWHPHTVKVLKHLQSHMRDPDADSRTGDDDEDLPDHLQFQEMTKKVTSRRNAASVFFELLQLKTWDFIDVGQEDEYGDIKIAPGVRFGETPPSK
eukprot:CAMPEP_0113494326 /NCGR_PEP_ID=MMETSP0014_2-20120614/29048_1 /TAXON_ID=2857 /ORGANISM="Nitzschia sp." /LENGTH=673 /DNA_ID=CAMNT_0000388213 /DNA_START=238 /DNA_END=2259 /DNA_ORIENTATION=- /assembly_acc=CAM_ASM_000159